MRWRIYYGDGTVWGGVSETDWHAAPDDGVQVVVLMGPGPAMGWMWQDDSGVNHSVRDRQMWTGDDSYDPFGWGEKRGSLISDADYLEIWRKACTDGDD